MVESAGRRGNWTKIEYQVYFYFGITVIKNLLVGWVGSLLLTSWIFEPSPFIFGGVRVANTKSAKKQIRNSYRKWLRNRYVLGNMRGAVQMVREAIADGDASQAKTLMPRAASQLDRAANRNIIHHRKAARLKSRLMSQISALENQS